MEKCNHITKKLHFNMLKYNEVTLIAPFRCPRKYFESIFPRGTNLEGLSKFFSMLCCFDIMSA